MFSSDSIGMDKVKFHAIDLEEKIIENQDQFIMAVKLLRDCTVRLKFDLGNGITIQGEITIGDVTWWECTKLQIAAWWHRNF